MGSMRLTLQGVACKDFCEGRFEFGDRNVEQIRGPDNGIRESGASGDLDLCAIAHQGSIAPLLVVWNPATRLSRHSRIAGKW